MVCGFSLVIASYQPVTAKSLSQRQGQHLNCCIGGSQEGLAWAHMPRLGSNQDKVAEGNLPGHIFLGSCLLATFNFGAAVSRFFVDHESNKCWGHTKTSTPEISGQLETTGDTQMFTMTVRHDPACTYRQRGSLSRATVQS